MRLRALAVAGARWTFLASSASIGVQLLQVFVLARMLSPADFGLMAVVTSVAVLLQLAADIGLSNAIIHKQTATKSELSTLFWLHVTAGAAVAGVALAAAPALATLYGESTLRPLMALCAAHLFLSGLWRVPRAMAQRDLRFELLAAVDIAASIAGLTASVALAAAGAGPLALAAGMVASSIAAAALAWLVLARGWRPAVSLRLGEVRDHLRFGAYATASELSNALASQVDILVGARLLGAQAIGLYGVSKGLCLQVASTLNPVVTQVGFPLMARVQEDRATLRTLYLRALAMVAAANFPLYVGLALFAPEVVDILLGPQWAEAAPLLRVLAWWGFLRSTVNPVGSLLMACGEARLNLWWNLAWLLALPAIAWLGSQGGALGLAMAVTAAGLLGWLLPAWYFLVRPLCRISLAEYLRVLGLPAALALAAGLLGVAVASLATASIARLLLGGAAAAAAYLLLSERFNGAWMQTVRDLLRVRARA